MWKASLKIVLTNWIHLLGFYAMSYLSLIFFKAIGLDSRNDTWETVLFLYPLTIAESFFLYGPIIIGGFYAVVIWLDVLCFNLLKTQPWKILVLEWLLVIPFFIKWAFEYKFWIWFPLCLSFLTTQFIRRRPIERLLKKSAQGSLITKSFPASSYY
jgi:hypothetical protein